MDLEKEKLSIKLNEINSPTKLSRSAIENDNTLCLGCGRKLTKERLGIANYCCDNCMVGTPCTIPHWK